MKKPWSVSTTVRNPERLVGLLRVLDKLEGEPWDNASQVKFQNLLIQHRAYGFGNAQFYSGLPEHIVNVIKDASQNISYELAEEAFKIKGYEDPPMRGRQSINPLMKLGFALIKDGKITVTELGKKAIAEEIDMGDAFLRCFLKWQIPRPKSRDYSIKDGYDINPFVGAIRLIDKVNALERARGNKSVGLQKREFALFVPTLINYADIDNYARRILHFRDIQKGVDKAERKKIRDNYRYEFAKEFLGASDSAKINKRLLNLADYGDNAIRYFRLTRFFHIRGNGYYVDLESRRAVEIREILDNFTGESKTFSTYEEYSQYISAYDLPLLPWETKAKKIEIAQLIIDENTQHGIMLGKSVSPAKNLRELSVDELSDYIVDLREERSRLQEHIRHRDSQKTEELEQYIEVLDNIFSYEDRPILLEKYVTLGLHALNDALNI